MILKVNLPPKNGHGIKPDPKLRINIIANVIGSTSNAVLAIIFTPFYIQFLGIEAYGLIGFYITLQASVAFLEMGLSRACNRELARYSGMEEEYSSKLMLDTLRSLEVVYWVVAVLLGVMLTAMIPWIADSWLKSSEFSVGELKDVLTILVWVIALRWPVGLYIGVLMGLQRQILMNFANVGISLLYWAGAAVTLWLIRPEIGIFFQWQLFVALCATVLFFSLAWRVMPGTFWQASFSSRIIKKIIPFAAGVGGNEVLATILLQADKLILSAILPLNQFGCYMLAAMIANFVSTLASPFSTAVFPRFSQIVGSGTSPKNISDLYHKMCQVVSTVVIPFALTIAFFSFNFLYVYTGSVKVAKESALVLSVLVVAKMLHASMQIPYAIQLAYGWVKLSLYINVASVLWIVPAVYFLTSWYGTIGAAVAWLIVTIGYVCVGMPLMHRKLLVGELFRWAKHTLIIPVLSIAAFLFIVRWLVDDLSLDRWKQGGELVSFGFVALMVAGISSQYIRSVISSLIEKRIKF